jgi:hypothetical protein
MNQDNKVIAYVSPDEMTALMSETGMITVHESGNIDGKPVIHAALKVVNAQTGEQLPGGLPFSVVMFKNPKEPGYSNIAIGTVVPAAELEINLPRDYFNFCNQRFRFTRVFPLDERSFVLQMDLFVRNATREYVKFMFGVWAAMFSQVLFELMGRGRDSLVAAAEAYAVARTDLSQQYVSTMMTGDEPGGVETAAEAMPQSEAVSGPFVEPQVDAVVEAGAHAAVGDPDAEKAMTSESEAELAPAESAAEFSAQIGLGSAADAEVAETPGAAVAGGDEKETATA